MKILFMGTGDIAIPAFTELIKAPQHELAGLICQPDKPVGRKQTLTPPLIKTVAEENGIAVFQPHSVKKPAALEWIAARAPDVIVVMAYGQILSQAVIDAPKVAIINLHASILPKYRGAAPIQAAIREGDAESGVTVMYVDIGLDSGDILSIKTLMLADEETGGSLHDRLADSAPTVMLEALTMLTNGNAPRLPQDEEQVTHVGKLDRADGVIDWKRSAQEIERLIRAYDPWPGTSTHLPDGRQLKIYPPCEIVEGGGCAEAGTILDAGKSGILIATGNDDALRLTELQAEGKKRMSSASFLAGNPLEVGNLLGNRG
jgi:methionyl-tRNA formyltransferase